MKAVIAAFNPEKALVRAFLRGCTTSPINRLQHFSPRLTGLTLVAGGEAPGGDGGDGAAPRHRHVVEAEDLVRGAGVKHRAGEHHRLVTLAWGDTENVNSVPNTA